ncbi:MAG: hypothetical protein ACOCWY_04785 [Thermodesulfobacteriota bacterium]
MGGENYSPFSDDTLLSETIHHLSIPVTPEMVVWAMKAADMKGKQSNKRINISRPNIPETPYGAGSCPALMFGSDDGILCATRKEIHKNRE